MLLLFLFIGERDKDVVHRDDFEVILGGEDRFDETAPHRLSL